MNFPSKQVMTRYVVVTIVLGLVCLWVFGKAAYIIIGERDYWMEVRDLNYSQKDEKLPATRGNILAADGQLLAGTLPQYRLYMDFMSWEKDSIRRMEDQYRRDTMIFAKVKEVLTKEDSVRLGEEEFKKRKKHPPLAQPLRPNERLDTICEGMARIFPDINPKELRDHILKGRLKKSHYWALYPKRISYIQYLEVKKLPLFRMSRYRSGFIARKYEQRKKPFGKLAARTIGDLYGEDIEGKGSELQARSGLELSFDSILRGKPGLFRWKKTRNCNLPDIIQPAEAGSDIQTTLDVGMQDICEKALGDRLRELPQTYSGVCILMEVATGDIKAITSLSRNQAGDFVERTPAAVSNLYELGSVFKPVSFMVAMDDGYLKMSDGVNVGDGKWEMHGRVMKDHNWRKGGYGRFLSVSEILQKSSNIGVSVLIDRFYSKDPAKFVDGLHRIGITEDLQVPIPGYTPPRIRRPKADGSNWSKTALPWMSIGYETQIPPISTVTFYNGVANGGKLVRPRLVKAILRNGEVVKEFPVKVLREQMCKPEVVKNLQECLEAVVSIGTGKAAGSRNFRVAGKTGTAQIWTKAGFASKYLVSFAGYFPADKPLYSCIVCIERGGSVSGGGDCGPVFRRVAETVMAQHTRSDLSIARDTVHTLQPLAYPGNMSALDQVLTELGIEHETSFSTDIPAIVWGTPQQTSGQPLLQEEKGGDGTVPDLTGYGLRDALFRLEKLGLRVKVHGAGRVSKQSLTPGHRIKQGETVVLTLGKAEVKKQPVRPAATQDGHTGNAPGQQAEKAKDTATPNPVNPNNKDVPAHQKEKEHKKAPQKNVPPQPENKKKQTPLNTLRP